MKDKYSRNTLLSVILGDGYLGKSGEAKVVHCAKQKDYLEWKRQVLVAAGIKCGDIKPFNNGGYPAYSLYIPVTRFGKLLRKILYKPSGKDFYNRKLLERLDPIHLAIWYMDDGGLSQKKRDGEVIANELMLNTHTTRENNQILIDFFKECWGVKFSQVKNKGHYRLRCGTKEARKFIAIIREYVELVPSMAHKINVKPVGGITKIW